MRNLLVPVDLSPFSNEIAQEAIKLAKVTQSKIYLLHVVSLDVGFIIGDVGFQYLPELEKTVLEKDAKDLHTLEQSLTQSGIEVETIIKQGIPVDVILEQSKELNIDTIVIGSKGHGTLYEALVGSVCHDVIKHSEVPVYVIPNKEKNQ